MVQARTFRAGGLNWLHFASQSDEALPPLVILHGLFGSADNWQSQARVLAGTRDVFVPDLPNHGRSDHTERVAYADVAIDMWAAIDEAGLGSRIALLGHSMGGKIAMALSFLQPDRTAALVVADIAPRVYPPRHETIITAMHAVADARPESRAEAERIMSDFIPEKAVRLFLLKSLVPSQADGDGPARYGWQLNLQGLSDNYTTISDWPFSDETFGGITHVVAGGGSPYVQPEDHDRIRRHFPRARIDVIPGVGHWLHAEARDEFLAIVGDTI